MEMSELLSKADNLITTGTPKIAWTLLEVHGEADTPSNVHSCLLGAMALQKMGQLDLAWARIEAWLADPKNASNAYVLRTAGFLLEQLARPEEALRFLEQSQDIFRYQNNAPDAHADAAIRRIKAVKTRPVIDAKKCQKAHNEEQPRKKISAIKIPKMFNDWSDALACGLWILQLILLVLYLVLPNFHNIDRHPTYILLKGYVDALTTIKLSLHSLVIVGIVLTSILAGAAVQSSSCRTATDESLVFDQKRRIWSYHGLHVGFLLCLAATLFLFNDPQAKMWFSPAYRKLFTMLTGLAAVGLGSYCLWLILPAARPRYRLICTPGDKANRLVISQGLLILTTQTLLPPMLRDCQIPRSLMWVLTFTRNLDVNRSNGESLRLVAPGSMLQAEAFANAINKAIRDGKTTVDNGTIHNDNKH